MLLLFLFMLSDAAGMDVAAAAVAATTVGGAAALGLSYYRVPLLLTKLPPEDSSFAVRTCEDQPAKGRGLFAKRAFAEGDLVIEYRGDVVSWKGLAERYGAGTINLQGKYVFELRELGSYIDAGDEGGTSGVARFINHSRRSPNLVAEVDVLHSRVWFVACLPIAVDNELCFDYGERYWEGWEGELYD